MALLPPQGPRGKGTEQGVSALGVGRLFLLPGMRGLGCTVQATVQPFFASLLLRICGAGLVLKPHVWL